MSAASAAAGGSFVLINKPTIIDGKWREVPVVVQLRDGRIVSERLPIREQIRQVSLMLAVIVFAAPWLFIAADWLRYS